MSKSRAAPVKSINYNPIANPIQKAATTPAIIPKIPQDDFEVSANFSALSVKSFSLSKALL